MHYQYLVVKQRLGLILNPDAEQSEPWEVAFSPTDIQTVEGGEWFGEYDLPVHNFTAALARLREQGGDLAPLGQTLPYPTPPYAGLWDGAEGFYRSICAGNFWFGGAVEGERRPVWIWTGEGGDLWAAFQAISPVSITAHWRGGQESVIIPAGDFWCSRYATVQRVLAAFPRELQGASECVDVLGRW